MSVVTSKIDEDKERRKQKRRWTVSGVTGKIDEDTERGKQKKSWTMSGVTSKIDDRVLVSFWYEIYWHEHFLGLKHIPGLTYPVLAIGAVCDSLHKKTFVSEYIMNLLL